MQQLFHVFYLILISCILYSVKKFAEFVHGFNLYTQYFQIYSFEIYPTAFASCLFG